VVVSGNWDGTAWRLETSDLLDGADQLLMPRDIDQWHVVGGGL
jgi:hypothetical protein